MLGSFSGVKAQSRPEHHDALAVMLFCGGALPPLFLAYGENRIRIRWRPLPVAGSHIRPGNHLISSNRPDIIVFPEHLQ